MFLNKLVDMVDFGLFPKNVIASFWLHKITFFLLLYNILHTIKNTCMLLRPNFCLIKCKNWSCLMYCISHAQCIYTALLKKNQSFLSQKLHKKRSKKYFFFT